MFWWIAVTLLWPGRGDFSASGLSTFKKIALTSAPDCICLFRYYIHNYTVLHMHHGSISKACCCVAQKPATWLPPPWRMRRPSRCDPWNGLGSWWTNAMGFVLYSGHLWDGQNTISFFLGGKWLVKSPIYGWFIPLKTIINRPQIHNEWFKRSKNGAVRTYCF